MAAVEQPATSINGDLQFKIGADEHVDDSYPSDSLEGEVLLHFYVSRIDCLECLIYFNDALCTVVYALKSVQQLVNCLIITDMTDQC